MGLLGSCKSFFLHFATLFPSHFLSNYDSQQFTLLGRPQIVQDTTLHRSQGLKFPAPNGSDSSGPFFCEYPTYGHDWTDCSTSKDRTCWLRESTGKEFNIATDYETTWPTGITREVWIMSRQNHGKFANVVLVLPRS